MLSWQIWELFTGEMAGEEIFQGMSRKGFRKLCSKAIFRKGSNFRGRNIKGNMWLLSVWHF